NGTVGTATVTAPDNVYVGANDPVVKSIATVEGADVGKFEQLTLDKTPVSTTVTDEPGTPGNPGGSNEGDLVKVTITADQTSVAENVKPTNPTPAQTTINDSVDTTTATLTASPSVTEGGVITYTVTLSNPAQTPVTVTLSNGQTITVEAGKTQGSIDFQTPANDVYNNGSTVSVTIE
ncbi:immunoglobulin-like domain-containing protein, partial [Pseudomonas sp. DCB_BG]|uniref:immunoglobulin-like domain-containing protein n=1 Tax=Pseudomonas sp. DCB_BG TaxID=2993595 RepID=UPI0022495C75